MRSRQLFENLFFKLGTGLLLLLLLTWTGGVPTVIREGGRQWLLS